MIVLGSDHAGFPLKEIIIKFLIDKSIDFIDIGVSQGKKEDYPIIANKVAEQIRIKKADKGILFCGSGIGMAIAANKVDGIRCAVCSEPYSAKMSRLHNDANVLALGYRVVGEELAVMIVDIWINSEFEGGKHIKRLKQISDMEKQKLM